jgi:hypothetical protein
MLQHELSCIHVCHRGCGLRYHESCWADQLSTQMVWHVTLSGGQASLTW